MRFAVWPVLLLMTGGTAFYFRSELLGPAIKIVEDASRPVRSAETALDHEDNVNEVDAADRLARTIQDTWKQKIRVTPQEIQPDIKPEEVVLETNPASVTPKPGSTPAPKGAAGIATPLPKTLHLVTPRPQL